MVLVPDRSTYRRDTLSFVLCIVLSVVALFVPQSWGDAVSTGIRRTALQPFLWMQRAGEEGRTSRSRFRAVESERDSAALMARSVPGLAAENRELRRLLGLSDRLGPAHIAAEVLHQPLPTDGRTLLLGVGRNGGVKPFSPVLAPQGLVGVVRQVGPNYSVAMTWADPDFRVSALTLDGSISGIVAAAPASTPAESMLELQGVPYRDSLAAGTLVVSSGLGGVYPHGIPIGTVIGVLREERGWERTYLLRPAANPSAVSHVIILVSSPTAVDQAYPADSLP